MIISKKNLIKIIKEELLKEDTRNLEDDVLTYLTSADNSNFFSTNLKIDKKMIPVLAHVAIGITGRESSYGESDYYKSTDWAETAVSSLSNATGIEWGPVRQYSVGVGQVKFSSANKTLSDEVKKKIGIEGPGDLSNDFKSIIVVFAMICEAYNKAKNLGYNTSSPGSIVGATCHENAKKIFESTGNAALDIAIVAHNAGIGKIKSYPQGTNYIPCYGEYCVTGENGTATYGYVRAISKYLKSKSINAKE